MAPCLEALGIFAVLLSSVCSAFMVAHNGLKLELQGILCPLLDSVDTTYMWCSGRRAGKTPIHLKIRVPKSF